MKDSNIKEIKNWQVSQKKKSTKTNKYRRAQQQSHTNQILDKENYTKNKKTFTEVLAKDEPNIINNSIINFYPICLPSLSISF